MPLISVSMFPGRTPEQKRELVAKLTDAFVETCGGNREGVWVVVNEVAPENWGIGGTIKG